jgi:hypothetical protein
MHQDIEGKGSEISYVVCPKCKCLSDTVNARAASCGNLGITLGYYLYCENCHELTFLRFVGPPLLDLHNTSLWVIPNA